MHVDEVKSFQFVFAVCILLCIPLVDYCYAEAVVPSMAPDEPGMHENQFYSFMF